MHHSGSQHFEPAGTFADIAAFHIAAHTRNIHFRARFGEREEAGSEFELHILAEQLLKKVQQCAFQVCKRDVFSHNKAFDLMEDRGVACVDFVLAVHASRTEHLDREACGSALSGSERGMCVSAKAGPLRRELFAERGCPVCPSRGDPVESSGRQSCKNLSRFRVRLRLRNPFRERCFQFCAEQSLTDGWRRGALPDPEGSSLRFPR